MRWSDNNCILLLILKGCNWSFTCFITCKSVTTVSPHPNKDIYQDQITEDQSYLLLCTDSLHQGALAACRTLFVLWQCQDYESTNFRSRLPPAERTHPVQAQWNEAKPHHCEDILDDLSVLLSTLLGWKTWAFFSRFRGADCRNTERPNHFNKKETDALITKCTQVAQAYIP